MGSLCPYRKTTVSTDSHFHMMRRPWLRSLKLEEFYINEYKKPSQDTLRKFVYYPNFIKILNFLRITFIRNIMCAIILKQIDEIIYLT